MAKQITKQNKSSVLHDSRGDATVIVVVVVVVLVVVGLFAYFMYRHHANAMLYHA